MRKLSAFLQISLDGCFAGPGGDLSWAHKPDAEFQAFVSDNAKGGGTLLFGRKTYEMMASYWPTPMATQNSPIVADRMNQGAKIVFSRTLQAATWNNTRLIQSDLAAAVQSLKSEPGEDMVILGSGSLVRQLAEVRLIDELQFVVNPILLGEGAHPFMGLAAGVPLKRTKTRTFENGNLFVCYEPVR